MTLASPWSRGVVRGGYSYFPSNGQKSTIDGRGKVGEHSTGYITSIFQPAMFPIHQTLSTYSLNNQLRLPILAFHSFKAKPLPFNQNEVRLHHPNSRPRRWCYCPGRMCRYRCQDPILRCEYSSQAQTLSRRLLIPYIAILHPLCRQRRRLRRRRLQLPMQRLPIRRHRLRRPRLRRRRLRC